MKTYYLDVAKSVDISSTLPTAIQRTVYSELFPAEMDTTLDHHCNLWMILKVIQATTPDDIPLEFSFK